MRRENQRRRYGILRRQGCSEESDMDGKTQGICLQTAIPNEGDSIMIVNCGDHYEMHSHSWQQPSPLILTDEDIAALTAGKVTWN
jgi:hypothetical protein